MTAIHTDVLVVGAGAAGLAAAVAAAKSGCQVVVVEKNDFPGGRATASAVGTICGLKYRTSNPESPFVHSGFPKEFSLKVKEASQSDFEIQKPGLQYLPYHLSKFSEVARTYLSHPNIQTIYSSTVVHANQKNGVIKEVVIDSPFTPLPCYPKAVVDCSGISVLTSILNMEEIRSSEYQSAAQVFRLKNVHLADILSADLSIKRAVIRRSQRDELHPYLESLSAVPGSLKDQSLMLKMGLPDKVTDDAREHAALSDRARNFIPMVVNFLKQHVEAFASSELDYLAPETGFRVGKRPLGKSVLTGEDVMNCRKSKYAVAQGTWPIEIWREGSKVEMTYFDENDGYDITLDHMRTSKITNLLFAGRMISADDQAIASARVIGTCLATGTSAGLGAAGLCLNWSEEEIFRKIQTELFQA